MKHPVILLAAALFLGAAVPAQALVPPFDNVLAALLAGKKTPQAVQLLRQSENYGPNGTTVEEQILQFTPSGKFRLETRGEGGHTIAVFDGKKGADWIEGQGYCPRAGLSLEPFERLLVAGSEVDFKLAALPLAIDYGVSSIALGPDGFVYAYGAERESEAKNQLLIDPEKNVMAGLILAGPPARRLLFRDWRKQGGVHYPAAIEFYSGSQKIRSYRLREARALEENPAWYSPAAFEKKEKRRTECTPAVPSPAETAPDVPAPLDPNRSLRELDQRFGK